MAADKEIERLRSVIAVLERELAGTASIAELRAQERDEWKAHAERLREAWSEADSNSEESVLNGDVFGQWLNGNDYEALSEVFDEAPQTSLARLKAQAAVEALEEAHGQLMRSVGRRQRVAEDILASNIHAWRRQAESQP